MTRLLVGSAMSTSLKAANMVEVLLLLATIKDIAADNVSKELFAVIETTRGETGEITKEIVLF